MDPEESIKGVNFRDDEDAHNRQRIRQAILEGDIDQAMEYTNTYYPTVLRDNEQVYFRLRCRKFIEMIRKEAELNMLLERRNSLHAKKQQQADDNDEEMLEAEEAAAAADNHNEFDSDEEMDLAMAESDNNGLNKLSQDALAYGMELRSEFKTDPRRETVRQLDEIFSLIAYPNPLKVKEVAHLLDWRGRLAVAEELNSAILSMFSLLPSPAHAVAPREPLGSPCPFCFLSPINPLASEFVLMTAEQGPSANRRAPRWKMSLRRRACCSRACAGTAATARLLR